MLRRPVIGLATALALLLPACGGPATTPESAPAASTTPPTTLPATTSTSSSLPSTSTAPAPTNAPTTAPTTTVPSADPAPRDDLGTCEVMGPSDGGWEVLLRIPAALGGGAYRVEYALRDGDSAILDRLEAEIALSEDDVVQYWDSPRTSVTDVASCDVLRLLQGNEACVGTDDCVISV